MTNGNLNLIHSLSGLDWKYTIGLVSVVGLAKFKIDVIGSKAEVRMGPSAVESNHQTAFI